MLSVLREELTHPSPSPGEGPSSIPRCDPLGTPAPAHLPKTIPKTLPFPGGWAAAAHLTLVFGGTAGAFPSGVAGKADLQQRRQIRSISSNVNSNVLRRRWAGWRSGLSQLLMAGFAGWLPPGKKAFLSHLNPD